MNTNPREPRISRPTQNGQARRGTANNVRLRRKKKKGIKRLIRNVCIAARIIAEEAMSFLKRLFTGKHARKAVAVTALCAVMLTAIISVAAISSIRGDDPKDDAMQTEDEGEDHRSDHAEDTEDDTSADDTVDNADNSVTDGIALPEDSADNSADSSTDPTDPDPADPADPTRPVAGPTIPESAGYSTVTVTFWGKESLVYDTLAESVGEFLDEADISLTAAQTANVDKSAPITDGMTIAADKVSYETEDVEEVLEYTTEYRESAAFPRGTTKVTQYGKNGKQTRRYTVTLVNGVEVARDQSASWINEKPTTHIITNGVGVVVSDSTQKPDADGTGGTFVGADGVERRYAYYIDVRATCYYQGGITASGLPADENVIAVDPAVIPLGTKVYVTGGYGDFGVRIAADTGGDIKGYKIDVCIDPNHPLAYNFGWRDMRVYILE